MRNNAPKRPDQQIKLGELQDSPWKYNPRDSYRVVIGEKTNSSDLGSNNTPLKGESPFRGDSRLVDIEKSADLGELSKYAVDDPSYHPQMYGEEDDNSANKNYTPSGIEDPGKGVFNQDDLDYTRKSNPYVPPEPIKAVSQPPMRIQEY